MKTGKTLQIKQNTLLPPKQTDVGLCLAAAWNFYKGSGLGCDICRSGGSPRVSGRAKPAVAPVVEVVHIWTPR